MNFRKTLVYISLILTLLVSQYATVVHASIHDFHEHEEACDIFQIVERASNALTQNNTFTFLQIPAEFTTQVIAISFDKAAIKPRSRSPPSYLFPSLL